MMRSQLYDYTHTHDVAGDNSPKPTMPLVPLCAGWWGQPLDINMASSYSTDTDILIAFDGNMGH